MLQMTHICERLGAAKPIMDDIVIGKASPEAGLTLSASGVTYDLEAQMGRVWWGRPSIVFKKGEDDIVKYWRSPERESFEQPAAAAGRASKFARSMPATFEYLDYETLKKRQKGDFATIAGSLVAIAMLIFAGTERAAVIADREIASKERDVLQAYQRWRSLEPKPTKVSPAYVYDMELSDESSGDEEPEWLREAWELLNQQTKAQQEYMALRAELNELKYAKRAYFKGRVRLTGQLYKATHGE